MAGSMISKIGSGLLGTDIGIDLGTASVLVYIKGRGIVLQEPSVVVVDKETEKIIKVGREAQKMLGRVPDHIEVVRPLREGVISKYNVTLQMVQYFISPMWPISEFILNRSILMALQQLIFMN